MKNLANQKIVQFLADNTDAAPVSASDLDHASFTYLDHKHVTRWLAHRIYEFKNTIRKLLYSRDLNQSQNQIILQDLKRNFQIFCKTSGIVNTLAETTYSHRILLDVTFTMKQTSTTGIPRTVTQFAEHGHSKGIIPVFIHEDTMYACGPLDDEIYIVEICSNDIFIHADAGWNYPNELQKIMERIDIVGGKSVVILYDIIPLIYPQLSNDYHVTAFKNWLKIILASRNNIICISESVMNELLSLLKTDAFHPVYKKNLGWMHLGSNIQKEVRYNDLNNFEHLTNISRPFFLSVGTVEPRKAYTVALDAMELLWKMGLEVTYVIVGKYGWSQEFLKTRILSHTEYGKRLFWLNSASDRELQYLYKNAQSLVLTTLCEGFGLPVIEAAHYGLSSIVSDIQVFREIGGSSTQFFEVTNSQELAALLEETHNKEKVSPNLNFNTWEEAVTNMISIIKLEKYQHKDF